MDWRQAQEMVVGSTDGRRLLQLGMQAGDQLLHQGVPLNTSVAAISKAACLNPEQTKRVCEFANNHVLLTKKEAGHTKICFDVADPSVVLQTCNGPTMSLEDKIANTFFSKVANANELGNSAESKPKGPFDYLDSEEAIRTIFPSSAKDKKGVNKETEVTKQANTNEDTIFLAYLNLAEKKLAIEKEARADICAKHLDTLKKQIATTLNSGIPLAKVAVLLDQVNMPPDIIVDAIKQAPLLYKVSMAGFDEVATEALTDEDIRALQPVLDKVSNYVSALEEYHRKANALQRCKEDWAQGART